MIIALCCISATRFCADSAGGVVANNLLPSRKKHTFSSIWLKTLEKLKFKAPVLDSPAVNRFHESNKLKLSFLGVLVNQPKEERDGTHQNRTSATGKDDV